MRDVGGRWWRAALLFGAGIGLFLLVQSAWGEEGVRQGRLIAIACFVAIALALLVVLALRRNRRRHPAVNDIGRLLKAGKVDEAVRTGRALFEQRPADPHVAWNYTAALIKSGHVAEARRVFQGLHPDNLPPKMAAMYPEVRRALDSAERQ